jgi:hypothetical protein
MTKRYVKDGISARTIVQRNEVSRPQYPKPSRVISTAAISAIAYMKG